MPQSIALNIDCMEYMRGVPDKFFALAIVDPPYGIGHFTCSHHTDDKGKRVKNNKSYNDNYSWNESIPSEEYFTEIKRISKERVIWGANYYNCFEKGKGALIWDKGEQTETISRCEIASLSMQTKVSYVHINWQSGFYRKIKEGEIIHPCQKPVKLYSWILKKYAKPGDNILDTHLGIGSSRIACHKAGLDFVGCEIDKDYFDAQEKRFSDYLKQIKMEFI